VKETKLEAERARVRKEFAEASERDDERGGGERESERANEKKGGRGERDRHALSIFHTPGGQRFTSKLPRPPPVSAPPPLRDHIRGVRGLP